MITCDAYLFNFTYGNIKLYLRPRCQENN